MNPEPPWFRTPPARSGTCTIIGGGIAGCSVAYALDRLNIPVTLIEQNTPGSGASSNQRAVLRPHLVRHGQQLNRFNEAAFTCCIEQLTALQKTQSIEHELCGVIHLVDNPDDWPEFESTYPIDNMKASRLAETDLPAGALFSPSGGWVNLQSHCHALLNACSQVEVKSGYQVLKVDPVADASDKSIWQTTVKDVETGQTHCITSRNVIFANGPGLTQFYQARDLPLTLSAGQTTRCTATAATPTKVITGKRYLIPDTTHCTIGATHHRLKNLETESVIDIATENAANLTALAALTPALSGKLQVIDQWRSTRVSTPDRLPMVGALPDLAWYTEHYQQLRHGPHHQTWAEAQYHNGLYLLAGLGSRGLVTSALSAKLLANLISGQQQNDEQQFRQLLHPARFIVRLLKRGST